MISKKNEYVWYCPRQSCRAIVLKSYKPYLTDGIFKCKRCNEIINYKNLMTSNLERIGKLLKKNEIKPNNKNSYPQ